jgi:hypothetical protein
MPDTITPVAVQITRLITAGVAEPALSPRWRGHSPICHRPSCRRPCKRRPRRRSVAPCGRTEEIAMPEKIGILCMQPSRPRPRRDHQRRTIPHRCRL